MMIVGGLLIVAAAILTPGPVVALRTFAADLLLFTGIGLLLWGRKVRASSAPTAKDN
jgi:hypothetical protein